MLTVMILIYDVNQHKNAFKDFRDTAAYKQYTLSLLNWSLAVFYFCLIAEFVTTVSLHMQNTQLHSNVYLHHSSLFV